MDVGFLRCGRACYTSRYSPPTIVSCKLGSHIFSLGQRVCVSRYSVDFVVVGVVIAPSHAAISVE